jgi:hypothetical protein
MPSDYAINASDPPREAPLEETELDGIALMSDVPSQAPSDAPSRMPSDIPIRSSTDSPLSSSSEFLNLIQPANVTALITFQFPTDEVDVMDAETERLFESACSSEFLPEILPLIQSGVYQDIECDVLSQLILDNPNLTPFNRNRRSLQEDRVLSLIVRVSALASLPSDVSFDQVASIAFQGHSTELESILAEAVPYFDTAAASDASEASREATESTTASADFPVLPLVSAAVGGAFLAIVAAFFVYRWQEPIEAMSVQDIEMSSDPEDPSEQNKAYKRQSVSYSSVHTPETPLGNDSVPYEVHPASFVEPEDGLSPQSCWTAVESSRNKEYGEEAQKSVDEESADLIGLNFASNSTVHPSEDHENGFIVNPKPFLGFRGFQTLYSKPKHSSSSSSSKHEEIVGPVSSDISIDPTRAAGTPRHVGSSYNDNLTKMEDCETHTPIGADLRKHQVSGGSRFFQMHFTTIDGNSGERSYQRGAIKSDRGISPTETAITVRLDNTEAAREQSKCQSSHSV